ncbi:MAG: TolC family protein [Candidatus Omnitrophota bacterium]
MKNIIIVLLSLVFLLTPTLTKAEGEISLTLDEAIGFALRQNRNVLLKAEEVEKSKKKVREAQSGLFPTLNFTATTSDTIGLYSKDLIQTSTQATVKQYLFKGGKTIKTIKQNQYEQEISQALLDKTKLETALDVKKTFYTLLLADEFADVNKGILENTKEHLEFVLVSYQNGQASQSEILKIQQSLTSVQEAYEVSSNQIQTSQALLNNLLYFDQNTKIKPNAEFTYEPAQALYDEEFLKAMQNRPEIRQYEAQVNADKKAIEIAKADTRPNIYASWDYYSRSRTSLSFSPTKGWQDYNIVGVTFSWPIFDGWATKAKVEQAIVDLKETRLLKEQAIADIALELKKAYLDLKNAISKIKSSQADIEVYKDKLAVAEEKYKQGIISSLDLSDASLGYDIAIFNEAQAIYDYIIAKARLEKATGG